MGRPVGPSVGLSAVEAPGRDATDPLGPFLLPAWAPEDVARADAARVEGGADLMSVASAALATVCLARLREVRGRAAGARAVLLVGAGDNGGDALLAGALLRRRGVGVTALLCAPRHHGPGAEALRRAGGTLLAVDGAAAPDETLDGAREDTGAGAGAPAAGALPPAVARALAGADLVVDAVLGIGGRGAVRGAALPVLHALVDGPRPPSVVACDLPSGLDPADGRARGPVLRADVTVTFGVAKPGLLLPEAGGLVGELVVVPLGLEPHLPSGPALSRLRVGADPERVADAVAALWPWARRDADKYSRGVLGVAAGEPAYPGAAVMVARAAAGAGAGMVRLVPPDGAPGLAELVLQAVPEVVVQQLAEVGRVQAWVTGPGTSGPEDPRVQHVLTVADEPAVVDAGALTGLARALADGTLVRPERLLLTPHAGELDRLLGALDEPPSSGTGRWQAARTVAARTGATVLLKGPATLVVDPGGRTVVVPGGPPSLGTAGAGDVLAGIAGTLLAGGLAPRTAGVRAATHQAVAAARASGGGGPLRAAA
ncbi:bifunctional ADP-dependent NAD(P)H-hydrate dehydratase/NAD(P)H-hydrate epimerase, partial [Aquipuribacter hungaricus]